MLYFPNQHRASAGGTVENDDDDDHHHRRKHFVGQTAHSPTFPVIFQELFFDVYTLT